MSFFIAKEGRGLRKEAWRPEDDLGSEVKLKNADCLNSELRKVAAIEMFEVWNTSKLMTNG